MHFAEDLRQAPGDGKLDEVTLQPQELKRAEQLVSTLSFDFRLEKHEDEFQARLKRLIEAKQKGKRIETAFQLPQAPVIDMMTTLRKSLEATSRDKTRISGASLAGRQHREAPHRKAG